MAMGDLELARRVLAGDESASEAFFAEYFPAWTDSRATGSGATTRPLRKSCRRR